MDDRTKGMINGLIGVTIFSGSLAATRMAIVDLGPSFVTAARATIAAALGGGLLLILRETRPSLSDLGSLAMVALGVVVGFPLLTGLALHSVTTAHSMAFIGLLPLATAIFGVIRGGERPSAVFWVFSVLGSAVVAGFAAAGESGGLGVGDLLLLASIIVCGFGYAEGARLSRRLGGWQVISWALVLSLPIMAPLAIVLAPQDLGAIGVNAWFSLGYVSLFSMLIGFIFWYRGLALGGTASVGQLQLVQPLMGLAIGALVLHETIKPSMLMATVAVIVCVGLARKFARRDALALTTGKLSDPEIIRSSHAHQPCPSASSRTP